MEVKATLSNFRQSPRKMRLVVDLVRGKKVSQALDILTYAPKMAAKPVKKLLESAIANAKSLSLSTDKMIIKKISVDVGKILYRRQPRSHGMANPIRKRTSHIDLVIAEKK